MSIPTRPLPPSSPAGCAEISDLLPAYALGALDPEERRMVEAHLPGCPACRAELDSLEGVVGLLGGAVEPVAPPPPLRARLLEEIGGATRDAPEPAVRRVETSVPSHGPRLVVLPRMAVIGLSLAASLLLVGLAVAGVLLHQAQTERDRAQQGQEEVVEYLRNGGVVTALAVVPGAQTVVGKGSGSLIVAPNQPKALVVVYGLPAASGDHPYQVWVERAGQRTTISSISVDDEGAGWLIVSAPRPLTSYDVVGISRIENGKMQDLLSARIPHG